MTDKLDLAEVERRRANAEGFVEIRKTDRDALVAIARAALRARRALASADRESANKAVGDALEPLTRALEGVTDSAEEA